MFYWLMHTHTHTHTERERERESKPNSLSFIERCGCRYVWKYVSKIAWMCENQNIQNPIFLLPSNFRKLHYSLTVYLLIYMISYFS